MAKWPTLLRLVSVLERIADALDRAYPVGAAPPVRRKPSTIADLTSYNPAADFEAEQEEDRLRELGLTDGATENSDV
jgi:hypothetical protein